MEGLVLRIWDLAVQVKGALLPTEPPGRAGRAHLHFKWPPRHKL